MSLLKQSLHLVAAVVVVTIQIIAQPIFFGIFGSTTSVESMILIAVMGGICLGQSGVLNASWTRIVLMVSGIILSLLGLFYSNLIFQSSQSFMGEVLAGLLIILIVVSSGVLSSRAIYLDPDIKKNYFWHNIISAFGILCLFFIQVKLGNAAVCIVAGAALLLISLSHKAWSLSSVPLKINWNSFTFASLGLGVFSGIYLSSVLEVMELSIFPSGFEFHIYLFLTFLHLAVARYLPARKLKFYLIPIVVFITFTIILSLCFGGIKDYFFFNPSRFVLSLNAFPFRIAFLSFLQIFIFLIPYSFFAYVVPNRQLEVPNENHLFFVSLGNFLGFALPGIILSHPPIEILLPLLLILSLVWWGVFGVNTKKKIPIALVVAIITSIFLYQPTRRILTQSTKSRLLLTESVIDDNSFGLNGIQSIYRKEGKVGFVYKYNDIPGIGLGGYAAPMYSPSDLAKALTANDLIKKKKLKRVLILGLGNQLLLKESSILMEELKGEIERIDVVDNFPPYDNDGFKLEISQNIDFNFKKLDSLHIHTDDVFKFLAKKKYSAPYDLIVNNLTWPLYMSSRLTYTEEFYGLVKEALSDKGIFITRSFLNDQINCLPVHTFPFTESIRVPGVSSVIIGSKTAIGVGGDVSYKERCVEKLNLSKLFWGQDLYVRNNQKRSTLKNISDPRLLIYPKTGELKERGEIINRSVELFAKKYQKEIFSFDSNSSDIFAQYLYRTLSSNSRQKKALSIGPYFSKDIKSKEALSSLRPSCSFYKEYNKTFSHPPDALAIKVYGALLASYELKEDCI